MEFTQNSSVYLDRPDLDHNSNPHLISQYNLDAKALFTQYPAQYRTKSKRQSWEKMRKEAGYNPNQTLRLTRWMAMPLPETYKSASNTNLICSGTVFQYAPRKGDELYKQIDWHMNFADASLFTAYASTLLAQDELQVLEIPLLASVKEFLVKDPQNAAQGNKKFEARTTKSSQATPVLIGNADRVINLDTYPDASKDRPYGLYGNNFERASENAVDLATNILKPAHKVNILAMEAPAGGYGKYNKKTISYILQSCYTGFLAAKKESQKISTLLREEEKVQGPINEKDIKTNIFSGFWGCGAYGGDRELMVILQIIGAQLAGVDSLTIHAVHQEGERAVEKALEKYNQILKDVGEEIKVDKLIERIEKVGFKWGFSNGT